MIISKFQQSNIDNNMDLFNSQGLLGCCFYPSKGYI